MTDVTTDQEVVELSAADARLLRELTERARSGGRELIGQSKTPYPQTACR